MKLPCRMKYWRREWEEIPINDLDQEGMLHGRKERTV